MWYTYIGEDGWVHRTKTEAPVGEGNALIEEWDRVRNSEDPREVNRFLWQNCQDALDIIRNQLGVIEVLSAMLENQHEYIGMLEDEITRDEYGD